MTFTKTNFSGYSIQIRGIGTQAISVTTDPAVAVAFNDMPFIRNHFFEQEFYDVAQVEVLRGPQGTLYGRNATAGVVNLTSAKPTDQFEAMASADIGNYKNRRFEGMINLPIVDDRRGYSPGGRMDQARWLFLQQPHRQAHRWPRFVVWPREHQVQAYGKAHRRFRVGAFPGRRRPPSFEQAALQTRQRTGDGRWRFDGEPDTDGKFGQEYLAKVVRLFRFIARRHFKFRMGLLFPIMAG